MLMRLSCLQIVGFAAVDLEEKINEQVKRISHSHIDQTVTYCTINTQSFVPLTNMDVAGIIDDCLCLYEWSRVGRKITGHIVQLGLLPSSDFYFFFFRRRTI